jgi:hypothetical protein
MTLDRVRFDKGTKLLAGMLFARRFDPDYFFIFDADDLISKHVASFLSSRHDLPGWYVDKGFVFNYRLRTIQRVAGLTRFCGSSLAPNATQLFRLLNLPGAVDENSSQQCYLNAISETILQHVIGCHPYMYGFFRFHNLPMRPIPFRAAAWVVDNGENWIADRNIGCGVPVNESFAADFGVECDPTDPTLMRLASERMVSLKSTIGSLVARVRGYPKVPGLEVPARWRHLKGAGHE